VLRIPYARELAAIVALAAVSWAGVKAYGWAYGNGYNAANARAEQVIAEFHAAERDATERARQAERRANERLVEIEALQAAERERISSEVESRTADLVAGNLRLRREIAAYATRDLSRDAATTRELEASAQRGAALIAAAIGVGAEADAVQRGLIEAYEAVR
jgi:hypothetical protein